MIGRRLLWITLQGFFNKLHCLSSLFITGYRAGDSIGVESRWKICLYRIQKFANAMFQHRNWSACSVIQSMLCLYWFFGAFTNLCHDESSWLGLLFCLVSIKQTKPRLLFIRSQGHRAPVADMCLDASGGLLASASADRSARVWDVDGGFCTHHFTGHR